ncbi:ribosomal protein S16 domain-containing protein [Kalaharituber pfeilii]|nr:ribosomal protein S16 domain-containing protein [Kalaharituber pfeilii]
MVMRIRLARFGKAHKPVYNIVVAQARSARDGRPYEVIGTYDPIPKPPLDGVGKPYKDIKLDIPRAKYWLGVGAQPSDPVWRILALAGLIEPKWNVTKLALQNKEAAKSKEAKRGSVLRGEQKS